MPLKNHAKRLEYIRNYTHRAIKTFHAGYGGVCMCPRCGEKGYRYFSVKFNKITGVTRGLQTTVVHFRGKNTYVKTCYLGMGKL